MCSSTVDVGTDRTASEDTRTCTQTTSTHRSYSKHFRDERICDRRSTILFTVCDLLSNTSIFCRLVTQAGTYVKEFVHGDFGRTRPSLVDLFVDDVEPTMNDIEFDIVELDVEHVDYVWPPD